MKKQDTKITSGPNKSEMQKLEKLYISQNYRELEKETKKLIKQFPSTPELLNIVGFSLHKLGRLNDAVKSYEKAILINPQFIFAHNNLGNVFKDLNKFEEALSRYKESIKLKPNYAEAYYNQGLVYKKLNKYIESIKSFENAIKIKKDYIDAYFDLGQVFITVGKFEEAIINFEKVINLNPEFYPAYNNLFFTLLYIKKDNHNFFLSLAKKFRSSLKDIDKNLIQKYEYEKKPKKLKIGFVSGDFWEHPVGYILLNTLKKLQNKNLELFAYSNLSKKDNFSVKLKNYFDSWYEIGNKKDIKIINQIRKDKINILFDLSGHSAKNRLPLFIHKPAPVQISWGGYPGFIGIPEIDYVIGDSYVTPKNEEKYFTEKTFLLPNIWICFTPPDYQVKIDKLPAIKNKYITFGSFNNLSKINEDVIILWSKILKSVSNSKIFLKSNVLNDTYFRNLIINRFEKNNIKADSIILEGKSSRRDYLATYNKIDIALDPFPYSGGISSFESLWMGVPVLTLKGNNQFVSHQTESINHNSKMSDWVAEDENQYLNKAIKFASDIDALRNLRKNLREKILRQPSFDSTLFAKEFDRAIWKIWNKSISEK